MLFESRDIYAHILQQVKLNWIEMSFSEFQMSKSTLKFDEKPCARQFKKFNFD